MPIFLIHNYLPLEFHNSQKEDTINRSPLPSIYTTYPHFCTHNLSKLKNALIDPSIIRCPKKVEVRF